MAANLSIVDPKAKAKSEVVDMIKDVLAKAEAGDLIDFTYASSCVDGSMLTGFTRTEDGPRRLAAVSRLLHNLHQTYDDK